MFFQTINLSDKILRMIIKIEITIIKIQITPSPVSYTHLDVYKRQQQRGMQQIDALMHSRIANLSYAKYGRRDMQEQCGAGQHNNCLLYTSRCV